MDSALLQPDGPDLPAPVPGTPVHHVTDAWPLREVYRRPDGEITCVFADPATGFTYVVDGEGTGKIQVTGNKLRQYTEVHGVRTWDFIREICYDRALDMLPEGAAEDPQAGDRPIVIDRQGYLAEVCDEAQAVLEGADCGVYLQGERLIRIGRAADMDEDERHGKREHNAPVLCGMTTPSMIDVLSRHIEWRRFDGRRGKEVQTNPSQRIAEILMSRGGQWRFPRLLGLTECPCVTPSFRLIAEPGYDASSGLMVLPHPLDPAKIRRSPLPEDGRRALAVLREWLSTFPFATPEDESAAIAGALTAMFRRTLPSAPVIAITASTPATGKSRLSELFGLLATGRKPAFFTAGNTPEEFEKRLDTMLLTGDQVAVLDNLDRPLKSDALCSATTQETKEVRVLGESRKVHCQTNTALVLTGNNLVLLGDLQRRTLLIRLDAGCERPEERVFDRDAIADTRARRVALLHAALTIPLAYFAAGRPDQRVKPSGSFEDWDALIRRPLIWAGMPDPLEAAEPMREEDLQLLGMRALYSAWFALWGDSPMSPAQVIEHARDTGSHYAPVLSGPSADLAEALRGVLGEGTGKMSSQSLGYRLAAWQGRILDGHRITRAPRSAKGVRYSLVSVSRV